ncbi:MAG: tRNA pseudouridine(38-40) synthase TruA [Clostridiales bacterium]|nr:tRNA pseudouridine(38-40) synthase TruA [Clostridiales bacterium]
MKNIALTLSYVGSNYHGWQSQKNAVTVSDTLRTALTKLTGESVTLIGCGRTDAGVHAKIYVANFHSQTSIPMERLPFAVNTLLPFDISVSSANIVSDKFHATYSCTKKEYTYFILPSGIRDPFYINRAYQCHYRLETDKMCQAALHFEGTHDFAAVRSLGTAVKSTVRTIHWCKVHKLENGLIAICIAADGFLYNMARAIAGTLLCVGYGNLLPDDIPKILESCDRELAGPTAPPEGLYLTRLWYEKEVLLGHGVKE